MAKGKPQHRRQGGLERIPPAEAVRRYEKDPYNVYVKVPDFCRFVGLTPEEFKAEAAAGHIAVLGVPQKGGPVLYADLVVTAAEVVRWLAFRRLARAH